MQLLVEGMWLVFWAGLLGGMVLLGVSAKRPWNLSLLASLAICAAWTLAGDAMARLLAWSALVVSPEAATAPPGGNSGSALLAMEPVAPSSSEVVGAVLAKWLAISFDSEPDYQALGAAFFRGVDSPAKAHRFGRSTMIALYSHRAAPNSSFKPTPPRGAA